MRENLDQNNSEYEHFLRSVGFRSEDKTQVFWQGEVSTSLLLKIIVGDKDFSRLLKDIFLLLAYLCQNQTTF